MSNICGIEFKENGKIYNFNGLDCEVNINDYVIVDTEKGLQYGRCVKEIDSCENELKNIVRVATSEDQKKYEKNLLDAHKALENAKKIVKELDLDMNLIEASFTFDKKQLLITYVADNRIDFRELAKKLAAIYKTRIELHQMGPRDKAKEISGLGICGRELCCAKILGRMDSVSMNMAKNQGLALNPSKINGNCGRLLCCLAYEDEVYSECQYGLPNVGQTIKTEFGMGKVVNVDILKRKYDVNIDGIIKTIEAPNDRTK